MWDALSTVQWNRNINRVQLNISIAIYRIEYLNIIYYLQGWILVLKLGLLSHWNCGNGPCGWVLADVNPAGSGMLWQGNAIKKSRGTISKDLTSQKIRGDPAYKWFPTPLRIITSSHNHQLTSSPAHIITMSQHHLQLCQTLRSGSAAWVWDLIGKSSEWFVKGRIACAACWPQRVDVKTISSCKCSVRPACRQNLFATFYYCNATWSPCVW